MSRYQAGKEQARQKAIDFSYNQDNLSYSELVDIHENLLKLAKRYGLCREFSENGIF